jgi:protein TonB
METHNARLSAADLETPLLETNLDAIVFRSRNRAYGAYQLRRQSGLHTLLALCWGIGLFGAAVASPWLYQQWFGSANLLAFNLPGPLLQDEILQEILLPEVKLETELPATPPEAPPAEPAAAEPAPPQAQVQYVPPVQVDDNAHVPPPPNLDTEAIGDRAVGTQTTDGSGTNNLMTETSGTSKGIGIAPPAEIEPSHTEFFAGELPKAQNLDAIRSIIGYPDVAVQAGIQGTVQVRILVDAEGKYRKHIILNGQAVHQLLVKAVEKRLPELRFSPATQAGKAVPTWVTIPFKFRLN